MLRCFWGCLWRPLQQRGCRRGVRDAALSRIPLGYARSPGGDVIVVAFGDGEADTRPFGIPGDARRAPRQTGAKALPAEAETRCFDYASAHVAYLAVRRLISSHCARLDRG